MTGQPPPLPKPDDHAVAAGSARPLEYQRAAPGGDPTKRVFDRVAGPNLRLRDNLIQLACAIVGGGAGALIGGRLLPGYGLAVGAIVGLLISVLISGVVIGVIRFIKPGR